ncbi:MAG TPA: MFS transporter [Candidatus Aquiluna sp.]|nr:MFS transporter [Aquiluna sp.]
MDRESSAPTSKVASKEPVAWYPKYLLTLLVVVYAVNFIDRQILSILLESIRLDLNLNDTQLGFLTGFSFAFFYATLGIPIARIADRNSRGAVIAISVGLWSFMTAMCGFAQNFVQLLFARIGVAVGEAGGSPPAHSLISDYFPEGKRASALAIYATGTPIGILIGLMLGGWLNDAMGWRTAFFVVGAPGLLLAAVVWFTAKETASRDIAKQRASQVSVLEVFKYLKEVKSFRYLVIASSLHAFAAYGILQWTPTFLIRTHGMSTTELGLYLGLIIGITGVAGVLAGGYLADHLSGRDKRWYVWLPGLAMIISVPFYLGIYIAPTPRIALLFYIVPNFLANSFMGPAFATVQSLSLLHMRAVAAAVFLFVVNIVGLGLGPQAVGILSDLLRPAFAHDSLRWALCCVVFFKAFAAYFYWVSSKSLRENLKTVPR